MGVLFGSALGALAGFFLSPKSGEENREAVLKKIKELKNQVEKMEIDKKVKEIWGEVNEDGKKTFVIAKKQLLKKVDELQEKWQDFNYDKYVSLVEEAVDEAKSETKQTADRLLKLKDLFVKDWKKVMGEKKN